jgi:hypothetical protein
MTSLIWKEWREHIKWVPIPGLVILLVFLIDKPEEPMFETTDAYYFSLIAVVFGAALGFVQIFFEGHGDKRSLLLHRPLSPSRIFAAKVVAGISLYLLALGVPFVCLESWMATPGSMPAPYHWRTSLPWLADILSGLVYYFAGMVTAGREARWYGSRGLGLAAAFCCSYLVWSVPEFWQAVLAIGIIGSFVGLAAWGSFSFGGAYAPQPRVAKAALTLTFLAGLLILSMLGKQQLGKWLDSGIEYEYTIDRQGQVLFQRLKPGVGVIERTDLQGQEVPIRAPLEGAALAWTETPQFWSYRNSGRFYVKCANESKPGNERWYYDHAQGRLLGYDGYFHQFLGSFGPDGFTPAGQEAGERFPGELRYRCGPNRALQTEHLVFPDRVFTVDYARRQIRTLFWSLEGETIAFISRWKDELDKKRTGLVVSTDKSFHFLTGEGTLVVSVPRLYDPVRHSPVLAGVLETPPRYVVIYQSWFEWTMLLEPKEYRNLLCNVHEYDVDGRECGVQTLPQIPYPEASHAQALFGLATPLSEAVVLVGAWRQLRAEARAQGGIRKPVLLHSLDNIKYFIPGTAPDKVPPKLLVPGYVALILLSASASALGCLFLARRAAFSRFRCAGWATVGLLFGWVGLVLMLAVQDWPARVVCPKCRKLRVVTRDTCEHCGAVHAEPEPDSTEIFESSPTSVALEVAG